MLVAFVALVSLIVGAAMVVGSGQGIVYQVHPGGDLVGILKRLRAGDQVLIHAGTYRTPGFFEVSWAGTGGAPIVVRGAPGEARPVILGTPTQNIIDVSGAHFVVSHVELRGGSQGLRLGSVSHTTLEDLVVHDLMDVGISCDRPGSVCDRITIRESEIYDIGHDGTGEGIYVGCQRADCVFEHGLIERNVIHDTGIRKGDGIQIKPGSFGNTVRGNTIYRTTYPGITIWGCKDPARRLNLLAGNSERMTGGNGLWIIGQATVRSNTRIGPRRPFRMLSPCLQAGSEAAAPRSPRCAPPPVRC